MALTAAQQHMLRIVRSAPSTSPVIQFENDPVIRSLVALNWITFSPTGYGAGYVRIKLSPSASTANVRV